MQYTYLKVLKFIEHKYITAIVQI